MIKEEYWIPVKNFEGIYEISNFSRVRSLDRECKTKSGSFYIRKGTVLKPIFCQNGYYYHNLEYRGYKLFTKRSILVATHFIENDLNKEEVNHKNKNRLDDSIQNLEWTTRRENMSHAFKYTNKTSKYVGVSWDSSRQKWISGISIDKKHKYLGRFSYEKDAANAYKEALIKYSIKNIFAL